jgi:hypothetical protein
MLKFAHDCRQLLPEIDRSQSFYMIADGEAIQIQPYDDEDVLSEVEKFNVDIGKGPASCTNTIGNACDRSHLFKAAKKSLQSVSSVTRVDFEDLVLENKIFGAIENDHRQLAAERRRNICKGLVKIARSLNKVVDWGLSNIDVALRAKSEICWKDKQISDGYILQLINLKID